MERKCQECGEGVVGRSDKKFCSDQCRTSYNNRINSSASQLLRHVNGILKKNRRILRELNHSGKTLVATQQLSANGFDFRYFTNCSATTAGKPCYFCYDEGYLPISRHRCLLVRKTGK